MKNFDVLQNCDPYDLIRLYGSPLYVYNEQIIRRKCQEVKHLLTMPNYMVNYSAKANSNLYLLKIINDEGLAVDAMSPGEIFVELKAGFSPDRILFISNNVSREEFRDAINAEVKISVDSLSQLKLYGSLNPGGEVFIRFNPGVGAGHHAKVITGGKNTKFGVDQKFIPQIREILAKYKLNLIGINQHIGSHFDDAQDYLASVKALLNIAKQFTTIKYIDFGGGFGLPHSDGSKSLDLKELSIGLEQILQNETENLQNQVTFMVEPGRFIVAESGILLGTVHSVKTNYNKKYIGTDIGFNTFLRPTLYNAKHEIVVFTDSKAKEQVAVVGNICETGDILAKDIILPTIKENDVIAILNAGAYGYSMCSNYNNRLRPAEVLIDKHGNHKLIRRRDELKDLVNNYDF